MMTVSVDRGKWLVLAGIAVFPLLDVTLFVLMWALLGRTQPLDHAVRIASVAIVGLFLYRGHRWALWVFIIYCAVILALGLMYSSTFGMILNPFAVVASLVVLAAASVAAVLMVSQDVKAFLECQRLRRCRPA